MIEKITSLLRDKSNYQFDVENGTFDVNEECVFNRIKEWHITENRSFDYTHDMDEGCIKYVIGEVLGTLIISEEVIELDMVNHRIEIFHYGDLESSNKPSPISIERVSDVISGECTSIKLKQSASQMACLARYLGLMIGDLIPKNNKPWKLYRISRKIIGLLSSPSYTETSKLIFGDYIRDYIDLYIELYDFLTPKFHFLLHYIRIK
ncbi:hypothetical protein QAD02_003517 [Eretmocerus hayati]|uniref:Uncharacterized protein n=1 Tax=Eretmocerus hayati TaxID=131215 RepID=A0ACC2NN70_9HYME|nr:hypothetical protein QAD02_003517 [Eretmocerus hayati]